MRHGTRGRISAGLVALVIALAACSSGDVSQSTETTEAPAPSSPAAASVPVEVDGIALNDLRAALGSMPGVLEVSSDGGIAQLEGFVANRAEARAAEVALSEVEGVELVQSELVVLDNAVLSALESAGVASGRADGVGVDFVIRGWLDDESKRSSALAAVAEIAGIGDVEDQLILSVG